MTPKSTPGRTMLEPYDELLIRHANEILSVGMLACSILGLSAAMLLIVLQVAGLVRGLEIPTAWAFTGGSISALIHLLARRECIRGPIRYLVVFFVSMPTTLFVAAHVWLPSGAATYITGPASYLYFVFIVLSGFFFDARLPVFAGALAGAQYLGSFAIDQAFLTKLTHPDALFVQDLTSSPMYLFKAQMMLFAGVAVGVLARHTRRLIDGVLEEQSRRLEIDRLFGQYVSDEVKERILTRSRDSAVERKDVVVLFADIRSFTRFSEEQDPLSVVRQLNEYFDEMVRCIQEHGGVIDKFIGDAVMATFGGVLEIDHPCDAAVESALAMMHALDALRRRWSSRGAPAFEIGIGLHRGKVVIGPVGSERRKEFTVIGDAVNVAARLESLTKELGVSILLTNAVVDALDPVRTAQLRPLGSVPLRGRDRTAQVFALGPTRHE